MESVLICEIVIAYILVNFMPKKPKWFPTHTLISPYGNVLNFGEGHVTQHKRKVQLNWIPQYKIGLKRNILPVLDMLIDDGLIS